jgi:hypothetical protein
MYLQKRYFLFQPLSRPNTLIDSKTGRYPSSPHNLYLNFLKSSFLQAIPSSFSTPFGEEPSITPRTPLPWSDWAKITSTGLEERDVHKIIN